MGYLSQETFERERERERIFGTEWSAPAGRIWGPPRLPATSADRRLALLSVLIAWIALLAKIGLHPVARRAPQLLLLVFVLDWRGTLLAVFAILLARRAVRRIDNTRDKRGVMMAQVGLCSDGPTSRM